MHESQRFLDLLCGVVDLLQLGARMHLHWESESSLIHATIDINGAHGN